jgi:hypothetical protein
MTQRAPYATLLASDGQYAPLTRCLVDNWQLEAATPRLARLVPENSRAAGGPLRICLECKRLYWPGGHVRRMQQRLAVWQQRQPRPIALLKRPIRSEALRFQAALARKSVEIAGHHATATHQSCSRSVASSAHWGVRGTVSAMAFGSDRRGSILPKYTIERTAAKVANPEHSIKRTLIDDPRPRDIDQQRARFHRGNATGANQPNPLWRESAGDHNRFARLYTGGIRRPGSHQEPVKDVMGALSVRRGPR